MYWLIYACTSVYLTEYIDNSISSSHIEYTRTDTSVPASDNDY